VFSYITLGGRFTSTPDQFRAVSTTNTFREGDYDAFDHYDPTYLIEIAEKPGLTYDMGTDWKVNMIKKAENLDFYGKLIQHDNNQPLELADESMGYVYSNSAHWVERFEEHITDLVRILKPGGHLVLQVRNTKIMDYSSQVYAPYMDEKFHKIIAAGRVDTWKGFKPRDEILSILDGIKGAHMVGNEPVLGTTLAHIWDIGLRPLFNPLVKMANSLDVAKRTEIKEEWCLIFEELLGGFVETYECGPDDAFEFLITLQKT
jgi:SAM-dependent methyltransferase